MASTTFKARISHPNFTSQRFKVVGLSDVTGNDVSNEILDPALIYSDEDALQFAVAGKLGLEFRDVAVELQYAK